MKRSQNLTKLLALLSLLGFLTACVGEEPVTKSFTVSLKDVDVRQSSNETVTVDTAGVTSGTLTLETTQKSTQL